MYELMTLQEIPPKNAVNDFDNDLRDGMRPEFPEEVTEIVIFTLLFTSKCIHSSAIYCTNLHYQLVWYYHLGSQVQIA